MEPMYQMMQSLMVRPAGGTIERRAGALPFSSDDARSKAGRCIVAKEMGAGQTDLKVDMMSSASQLGGATESLSSPASQSYATSHTTTTPRPDDSSISSLLAALSDSAAPWASSAPRGNT